MKKKQFVEACSRMGFITKKYDMLPYTQQELKNGNLVISEQKGILYDIDEETLKEVRSFEEEYNSTVYHVIRNFTSFGTLDSYLYVSEYEEEWEQDREDLSEGFPLVYVRNRDDDYCSEFGSIQIAGLSGGLVRKQ